MRASRQQLTLMALFAVAGTMTIMSQNHASFKMIRSEQESLPIVGDLLLPNLNSAAYGAWSLTLQLLTPAADLIKQPQTVTRELEKVVAHTVSTHGLRLLGLTTVEPSRSMSRRLKDVAFTKRTSAHLLVGSAVDDDSLDEFDFDVETVNGVDSNTNIPDHMSLYMRAIIASTQPSSDSVAALVHLAKSGEVFSWGKDLKTAGLPIDGIEIVSLAPHDPNFASVEAKLQAKLQIIREEMNEIDSFDETHIAAAFDTSEMSFSSTTLSAFSSKLAGGLVSLGVASAFVSCLVIFAMMHARRNAAAAVAVAALSSATPSESFIKNTKNLEIDDLNVVSKMNMTSYC